MILKSVSQTSVSHSYASQPMPSSVSSLYISKPYNPNQGANQVDKGMQTVVGIKELKDMNYIIPTYREVQPEYVQPAF